MIEEYKSRIRWLENLSPPRVCSEEFAVSEPVYRRVPLEALWLDKGRFRVEEEGDREFRLYGDARFYRSLARGLIYLAEGKKRLMLLDKGDANERLQWSPPTHATDSRSLVICHHSIQLKRSEISVVRRAPKARKLCEWAKDTWETANPAWRANPLDVRRSRDTVFLTGSAPLFVDLARIAVALSRNPEPSYYTLTYVFARSESQPMFRLFKV